MQGIFDDLIPSQGSTRSTSRPPVYETPLSQTQMDEARRRDEADRRAASGEARGWRADARAEEDQNKPPAGFKWADDGTLQAIPGGPADRATKFRPLTEAATKRLEGDVDIFANLTRAKGGFEDGYAGNTVTGGLENTIQSVASGFGTPGQRDWWANFRSTDNLIRNELFGSALTDTEKAAYVATTISERMDPKEVKANLDRRVEIVRKALARRVAGLKANKYDPEAVDAYLGEYGAMLSGPANDATEGEGGRDDRDRLTVLQGAGQQGDTGYDEDDPALVGLNAEYLARLKKGQSVDQIVEWLGTRRDIPSALLRTITEQVQFRGANPKVPVDNENYNVDRLDDRLKPRLTPEESAERNTLLGKADTVVRGAANVVTMGGADEIAGTINGALSGDGVQTGISRENAIDRADEEDRFGYRLAGQLAGGLALPMGGAKTVGEVAKIGAKYGGAYGFGSAEGDLGDRLAGAVTGATAGAATAGALAGAGKGVSAFRNRPAAIEARQAKAATQAERTEVAAAAERQGVDLLPADVGGGFTKAMTAGMAKAPLSADSISKAAARSNEQLGAAAKRAADNYGSVLPPDEAGLVVRKGAELFSKETSTRIGRQYERAYEMANGVRIEPKTAIQVIDDAIASKGQAGEMSSDIVAELTKVRRSLAQEGGLTPVGIREARTILGSMSSNDKLRGTDAKRIFGNVLDAASNDMEQGLISAGRGAAARTFKRADILWKARVEEIDEVLEPLVGRGRSGEEIVKSVNGMSKGLKGGVVRLGRLMRVLPDDQGNDIAATILDGMGRARSSAQDDVRSIFSAETFLTNWVDMSAKGKTALFGNGELRKNIDEIAKIANARRDTMKYANTSNTSGALAAQALAPTALAGVISAPAAPAVAALSLSTLALQWVSGKLLANPDLVRALARAPKTTSPTAVKLFNTKLSAVAARNPGIANDIAGVQSKLLSFANDNAARVPVAASGRPEEEDQDDETYRR